MMGGADRPGWPRHAISRTDGVFFLRLFRSDDRISGLIAADDAEFVAKTATPGLGTNPSP